MKTFFVTILFLPLLSFAAGKTVKERLMEYREGTFELEKVRRQRACSVAAVFENAGLAFLTRTLVETGQR